MGTEIAILEPIQPPDVRRPAKLSTLPKWVEQRCDTCKKAKQPDKSGIWREVQVLPKSLILDQEQKMLVERHISSLDAVLAMTPCEDELHGQATLMAVTKMTLVLPSRETGDLANEARGEAFMAALEDVPSWAVQEAMRKWYRAEHGQKYDYKWQPAPATLRELAMTEVYRVKGVRRRLNNLLVAEPLVEFSPAEEEAMRGRVSALLNVKHA
ncbi:hypothetical protein ABIF26_009580 [Bradyrhizobium elkanii]